jgi:hypothetical protein
MFNIWKRPYSLLLYVALVLFIVRAFAPIARAGLSDSELFSIPAARMGWIIPLFLVFIWLNYLAAERFLYSITLSWIHVIVTVTSALLIVVMFIIGINPDHTGSVDRQEFIGNTMRILSLTFICGQFFYLANVLAGIIKKR